MTKEEEILFKFIDMLCSETIDMPPEFNETVDKHFWDLISDIDMEEN